MSTKALTILGGGPAGLAVGYYACQSKHSFVLFEAQDNPGGNCRTVEMNGFRYDFGAHRLHNVYQEITEELIELLGGDLKMINVPSHVYFNQKWVKFPLTPGGLLKVLGPAHLAKAVGEVVLKGGKDGDNFRDDAIQKYGKMVAENFLLNYSEKLWGMPTSQLSPKISGKRLKGLSVRSVMKDVLLKKHAEHLDGAFYYPKNGFGQIMEVLADKVQASLKLGSKITKVLHDHQKITAVEINRKDVFSSEKYINTLPINLLVNILDPLPPQEILDIAASISFRHVRLIVVFLNKESVSKSASLYFPTKDISFTRVYEPKQRSLFMAPKEQTCLVVEYPYFKQDSIDTISSGKLKQQTIDDLVRIGLIQSNEVIDTCEERLWNAYPVLATNTEVKIAVLEKYLRKFSNLYSLGRTASFEYTHFHDIMFEAKTLVNEI